MLHSSITFFLTSSPIIKESRIEGSETCLESSHLCLRNAEMTSISLSVRGTNGLRKTHHHLKKSLRLVGTATTLLGSGSFLSFLFEPATASIYFSSTVSLFSSVGLAASASFSSFTQLLTNSSSNKEALSNTSKR